MNCFAALCLVALLGSQPFSQRGPAMLMAQSQAGDQASSTGRRTPDQVTGSIIATRAPAPAQAADQPLPADAPTRDQVLTLLDLVQARQTMVDAMENVKQMMQNSAEESFRQKVPNATPKQIKALRGIFDEVTKAPLDEMINAVISIYQRHLTKTDVEELIRFYSSPVGQKLLREQPQIMRESMQAGAEIQRKRVDEIQARLREHMDELMNAGENGSAPKK
jgi:hypothetical protein